MRDRPELAPFKLAVVEDAFVAPNNVGPKTIPQYDKVANQAITDVQGGGRVFAGQRDDPFFVDLGATFDAINLRSFDEVIVSTLSARLSRWLKLDLPSKVTGLGLPVTTVTPTDVPTAESRT